MISNLFKNMYFLAHISAREALPIGINLRIVINTNSEKLRKLLFISILHPNAVLVHSKCQSISGVVDEVLVTVIVIVVIVVLVALVLLLLCIMKSRKKRTTKRYIKFRSNEPTPF